MSALRTRWRAAPYPVAAADAVAGELGLSSTAAAILARRGVRTPEAAQRFLAAAERHDPGSLPGVTEACAAILAHVERRSRIVVHGDYDVDGICSTAVLVRALRTLGADPRPYLPSRFDDGYGLAPATVDRLAGEGTDLLVLVDCGITAAAEVDAAKTRGMDVVVVDHHRPGDRLPACPVVHPALGDYPCPELCATGVAHKLAEALLAGQGRDPAPAEEDLDLVALATVADLVPLVDENRRLVREGLRALSRTAKPGLRALMRVAGVEAGRVGEGNVGFGLAPRLNAAGRLGRADAALELVLTEDEGRAEEVADELDFLNHQRREVEGRILGEAETARAEHPDAAALVLAGEDWHPGVIGIVASRLVEAHHRPVVLIALDAEGRGGRGSGRSIGPYDLHAGLTACAPHLQRFGGHRMAAGLEIDRADIEPFRAALDAHARAALTPDDLVPAERVDALVPVGALGLGLAEELDRLGPFGSGNPRPTLLVPAARLTDAQGMGEEGRHSRCTVAGGGARARAMAFRTPRSELLAAADAPHDIAARLEVNEWRGTVEPRLVLRAVCPSAPGLLTILGEDAPFWSKVARELDREEPEVVPAGAAGPSRAVRDRRGGGVAGVAGELIASGEPVLLVCADVPRRRDALERVVAGLAIANGGGEDRPAVGLVSWEALVRTPALAAPYPHVVAVDPPAEPEGAALLASAPASAEGAFSHLCWGVPEVEFATAVARAELDLRAPLVAVFRGLREASPCAGPALEAVLRGDGAYPRRPSLCGRLLAVLVELGLVELERPGANGEPTCRMASAGRTELERSAAFRAAGRRLAVALDGLASAMAPGGPRGVAAQGRNGSDASPPEPPAERRQNRPRNEPAQLPGMGRSAPLEPTPVPVGA